MPPPLRATRRSVINHHFCSRFTLRPHPTRTARDARRRLREARRDFTIQPTFQRRRAAFVRA